MDKDNYKQELEKELAELEEATRMIESKTFQKCFVAPLEAYRKSLKFAYDCDSLKEIHTVKGQHQGVDQFFRVLKGIHQTYKQRREDLDLARRDNA